MNKGNIKFINKHKTTDKTTIIEILYSNDRYRKYKIWELTQVGKKKAIKASVTFNAALKETGHDKYLIYMMLNTRGAFVFLRYFQIKDGHSSLKRMLQLIKFLQMNSPLLELLTLYQVKLSEHLICKLYFLIKERDQANNPMNLQIIRLYKRHVWHLPLKRIGFVLGLTARLCKQIFQTQVDTNTNPHLMKNFLTAADFASRKKKPNYVSTGGFYKLPRRASDEFIEIWPHARIRNNPKKWSISVKSPINDFYHNISDKSFVKDA